MAIVDFVSLQRESEREREGADWGGVGVQRQPQEPKTHVFTKQLIFFGKTRKAAK